MEYYYYTIVANYITNKTDFVNLMCVNSKTKKLNKWFKTINSPFIDDRLFPNNVGPKKNEWDIIYVTNNNKIKTKVTLGENISNIKKCYLHSINDPLPVSSRYKELPKIIIPTNKILSDMFRFNHLSKIRELSLPTTLTSIENKIQNCHSLTKINIPTSVKMIKNSFFHCDTIEEISIPSSVTLIEKSIIFNNSLTSIEIKSNNIKLIKSINYNHGLINITFKRGDGLSHIDSLYSNSDDTEINFV